MPRATGYEPCVFCDGGVNTNDTERLVYVRDAGYAHRLCFEQAIQNGDAVPSDDESYAGAEATNAAL